MTKREKLPLGDREPLLLVHSTDPDASCPDCLHGPLWHNASSGCTRMIAGWCQCPNVDTQALSPTEAFNVIASRLEAVMDVSDIVNGALDRLSEHLNEEVRLTARELSNPRGHVMGHNLCVYCLQYDEDVTEDCPMHPEEDDE